MRIGQQITDAANAVTDTGPPAAATDTYDSSAFQRWQNARARMRAAELRRAPAADVLGFATDVIRARNALTRQRIEAGWVPYPESLAGLKRDELLVEQSDDRND